MTPNRKKLGSRANDPKIRGFLTAHNGDVTVKKIIDMTKKEERFCREYVIDLNGTQAAIRAGYSEKTARQIGSENLSKPDIKERINELQSDLQKSTGLTAIRVLNEHKLIAFNSIAHLHDSWIELKDYNSLTSDQKACIKSISSKVTKRNLGTKEEPDIVDVEFVKIECWDKQKALDSISNLLGFNAPKEINQKIDFEKLTDDQLDMIIDKLGDGDDN